MPRRVSSGCNSEETSADLHADEEDIARDLTETSRELFDNYGCQIMSQVSFDLLAKSDSPAGVLLVKTSKTTSTASPSQASSFTYRRVCAP